MRHAETPGRRTVRLLSAIAVASSLFAARAARAGTISAGPYTLGTTTITATWSSTYPGGTSYTAIASTGLLPNGYTGNLSSTTFNLYATFTGLSVATQYDVVVSTAGGQLVDLGATATYAAVPGPAVGYSTFTSVSSTTLTVNWSSGTAATGFNPAGTPYQLVISTEPTFSSLLGTLLVGATAATLTNAPDNTLLYFEVQAGNPASVTTAFESLSSTATLMPDPTAVSIDEVYGTTITAAAYAPGSAFSNLSVGSSAINVAKGGVYNGFQSGDVWASQAAMPTLRHSLGFVAYAGKIYAIGGKNGVSGPLSTNEQYDPVSNTWSTKAAMPTARYGLALVVVDGKIYAIGGNNGTGPVGVNEQYDPATDSWTTKASMPTARYWVGGAAVSGSIYVVGGDDAAGNPLAANERYDPSTDAWTSRAAMTTARAALAAAAVNGALYSIGGDQSGTPVSTVEKYDPSANTWSAAAGLPTALTGVGAAVIGGKIVAVGGDAGGVSVSSATVYDPAGNVWTSRAAMPTARVYPGAAAVGGRLYAAGGTNGSAQTANEKYDPGVAVAFGGLTPNTQYTFKAQARGQAGTLTAESPSVSTYTAAAAPAASASVSTYSSLGATSFTLSWASGTQAGGFNPGGTLYLAQLSTSSAFAGPAASSSTYNSFASFTALNANATYYAEVEAYNALGSPTGFTTFGSTVTSAVAPAGPSGVSTYTNVTTGGFTLNWSSGTAAGGYDAAGTIYVVQLSTMASFNPLWSSTQTTATSLAVTGLTNGTSYYAQVQALTPSGAGTVFFALGSTQTVTGLSAAGFSGLGVSAVTASWTSGFSAGTSYTAQLSTGAFPNGFSGNKSSTTLNTFASFTGLSGAQTYYAQAETDSVHGPFYALGSTVTLPAVTGAASSTFSAVGSGGLTLAWSSGTAAGGYNALSAALYTAQVSTGSGFSAIAASSQTYNLAASLTGLAPNTTYFARVQASNAAGTSSAFTAYGSTLTLAAAPGAAPSTFTSVSGTGLTLNWSSGTNPSGTLYVAVISTKPGFSPTLASSQTYNSYASFAGLTPDSTIYAEVQAVNGAGTATSFVSFGSTGTPAAAPGAAAFTSVGTAGLTANWTSGGNAAGTQYDAQISTDAAFGSVAASSITLNTSSAFAGLSPNATYYARAAAYDVSAGTWSAFTSLSSTITLAVAPAAPPGSAFTSLAYSSFTVNWSSGSAGGYDPAGTLYLAELALNASFSPLLASSQTYNLSAQFAGLTGDTTHYARVRAYNGAGTATSAVSLGSAITPAQAPVAGGAPFSAVTTSGLTASFTAPSDPAGTTFYVQLSTAAGFSSIQASSRTFNQSAAFSGLSLNATYFVQAAAYDVASATWSAFTSLGSTITLAAAPGQPAGSTFTAVYVSSLTVQWSANGDPAGTYYVVQLSTSSGFTTISASSQTPALSATLTGLSSGASYYAQVQALNGGGTATAFTSLGSTRTQTGTFSFNGFSGVSTGALTVAWTTAFGAGTTYYAVVSSGSLPNAFTGNVSSSTLNLNAAFGGLSANTLYFAEVATAAAGPFTQLASTYTLAVAPGAAASGIASATSAALTVAWSSGTAATGYDPLNSTQYVVNLATTAGFAAIAASSQTYNLTASFAGLAPNTTYFAEVEAVNGNSVPSSFLNIGSTMTAGAAPAAATPEFTGISTAAVTLLWNANGNPTGTLYDAILSTSAAYAPPFASSQTYNTSAPFTGLSPNTSYYPSVAAFDVRSGTWTAFTQFPSTGTPAAEPGPAASAFTGVGTSGVTLNWTANGNPSLTTYLYQTSTDAWATTRSFVITSIPAIVGGLTPNSTFYARVAAESWAGQASAFLDLGSTVTLAAVPASASVSTFTAVSSTGFTLHWSSGTSLALSNPAGTLYNVVISTSSSFVPAAASSQTYNFSSAFGGLTPDQVYYGEVQAINAGGTGTAFLNLGSTATPATVPGAASFSAIAATGLTASWSSTDAAGTTYYAQLSAASGFSSVLASSQTFNLSASFSGLTPNTTYYERTAAYDITSATWTAFAAAASTTTAAAAPGAATSTFTAVSISGLTVSWSSGSAGAYNPSGTSYVAQLSTSASFSPVLASSQTLSLSASFSGLSGGNTYYAQVEALNAAGAATSFTNLGSTITPTGPPSAVGPSFSAVTTTGLTASWSGNSPAGTTYYAQLATDAGFTTVVASSQTLGQSASFSGLSANVTYYAQAAAYDYASATWTAFTSLGSTSTLAAAPGAAAFTSVSGTGLTANWTANGDPAGTIYLARLATNAGFSPVLASSQTYGTSAAFAGLSANGTYYAQVEAVNNAGVATSFTSLGSTNTPVAAPAAPVGTSSFTSVTANSLVVNWSSGTAATGYDASGTQYVVQLSTMASFNPLWASSQTASTSASFTGLSYNATYYAQVEALAASGGATAFTSLGSTLTLIGLSPAGFTSVTAAAATVSFTTSFSSGTSYIIQASTGAFPNSFSGNLSSTTLNTSASFSGLSPNATYYVQGATAAAGPYYALGSTMTLANAPSSAATAFSGVSAAGLTAAWSANGDPAGTSFNAQISSSASFSWVTASSQTYSANASFASLTPNTTYFARAQAYNGLGLPTSFLSIGSTITLAAAPGAAASTFTAVGGNTLTLNWSAGADPAGTLYLAQISTNAGFSPLAASSATYSTSAVFSGLNPNTVYYAQARASNASGMATSFVNFGSTATPTATPGAAASAFTSVSASSLTFNWASNNNPAGTTYYAQLALDAGFTNVLASSKTFNLAAVFSSLSPNTSYYAQVAAYSLNTSTWTSFLNAGATSTLANVPSSLALTSVGVSSIAFSWSANGDPAGTAYLAQISTDNFATVSAGSSTLSASAAFSGLQSNATYFLRAAAVNNGGVATSFAALAATWTYVAAPASAAPSSVGVSSVTAAWGSNGDAAGTYFTAQVSTDNFASVEASSATLNASAVFSGLTANTTYYFRVQATGNNGQATAFTTLPSTMTLLLAPGAAAPAFTASSTTAVTLNWTSGGNGAGTTYVAQVSTDGFASVLASSATLNLSAQLGSLTPNTTYYGRVDATSGGNASAFVSLGSTITLAAAPGAPGSPFSGVSGNGLTASWLANGDPAGTTYVAQLSTSAGFSPLAASSQTYNTSASFSGLAPNAVYFARVEAVNAAGAATSFVSLGSTATPTAVPGGAASTFTAVSTTGLTVNWTSNNNPAGTTYYAQLALDAGFASVVASSQTLGVSAAFSALSPNTPYFARAAAFSLNTSTWTAFASLGSTSTLADVPSGAALVSVQLSSISFSWSANGNPAGTTYAAQLSTDNFASVGAASSTLNTSAAFTGLQSNATYYLRVAALSGAGAQTAFAALPSTWTLAAAPSASSAPSVGVSSMVVMWSANGDAAGTTFFAQLSTDNFASVNASAATSAVSTAFTGLTANTTYYFRVQAIANNGAATAFTTLSPAMTSLLAPAAAGTTFSSVGATALTASWTSGGNGAGTSYVAQLSTDNFASVSAGSTTLATSASYSGLTPNTTYFARVEAASGGNTSAWVGLGSTITLANPPTGTGVSAIRASSATLSWSANGNPAATATELQQSLDGVTFAPIYTGAVTSVVDSNLLGCTTYWVKLRNVNRAGTYTGFDTTVQFVTAGSTPSAAIGLTAAPSPGNKIFLSWTPSPSPGITQYDLFWDNGTGSVSFGAPYATLTSTQTTFTTGVLASSAAYTFSLRAKNSCGLEETTGVYASAPSTTTLSAVSVFIKAPASGKHVTGNSVTLMTDLSQGTPDQVASVLFQYRPSGGGAWQTVSAANANHPNPATSYPFFIQWNMTGAAPALTPGASYDVRAVAVSVAGSTDTAPAAITIVYDPTPAADITQNVVSGQVQTQQLINNAVSNTFAAAGLGLNDPAISVVLPAGALSDSTVTVTVTPNPTITTGPPSGFALVGSAVQIDLGNGQHLLNGGLSAGVTLTYPNTVASNSNIQCYSLDTVTGQWSAVPSSVDTSSRTLTCATPHFSIFAVVAGAAAASNLDGVRVYPNPYKPNGGNPDEGKPYSAGDPTSGIIFDKLPQNSSIKIYNLSGQLVASMDGTAGGTVRWDARNNGGRAVASGMYFAVVSSEGFKSVVKKVAIIR